MTQDAADGADEDLDIHGERPVLNIVDVESATFVERNVATAGDLRESSDARFNTEDEAAVAVVFELDWLESAKRTASKENQTDI